jgi:beta-galactosidase
VIVLDVVGPSLAAYVPSAIKAMKSRIKPFYRKNQPDDGSRSLHPCLFAQNMPELDKLNVEKSRTHNNPGDKPDLNSASPIVEGQFTSGNGWQTVRFASPKKGRYIALQALSTQAGDANVAVAEIYVTDVKGNRLSREPWTIKYADSEEIHRGNNTADKTFDLQESTYWRTAKGSDLPHLMVIDLGSEQTVTGLEYLPRAEEGAPGSIKGYKIFVY